MWVAWRSGPTYIGWAPLPPRCDYGLSGVLLLECIVWAPTAFVYVERHNFCQPQIHHHVLAWRRHCDAERQTTYITKMENQTVIINNGPDVNEIERSTNQRVPRGIAAQLWRDRSRQVVERALVSHFHPPPVTEVPIIPSNRAIRLPSSPAPVVGQPVRTPKLHREAPPVVPGAHSTADTDRSPNHRDTPLAAPVVTVPKPHRESPQVQRSPARNNDGARDGGHTSTPIVRSLEQPPAVAVTPPTVERPTPPTRVTLPPPASVVERPARPPVNTSREPARPLVVAPRPILPVVGPPERTEHPNRLAVAPSLIPKLLAQRQRQRPGHAPAQPFGWGQVEAPPVEDRRSAPLHEPATMERDTNGHSYYAPVLGDALRWPKLCEQGRR